MPGSSTFTEKVVALEAWQRDVEQATLNLVDQAATRKPPCDFCRRDIPCECATTKERFYGDETCMCTCGRCRAEPLPEYRGPWVFDGREHSS